MTLSLFALAQAATAQPTSAQVAKATKAPAIPVSVANPAIKPVPGKKQGEFEVMTSVALIHPRSEVIIVRGRFERTWDVPASAQELQNPFRRTLRGDLDNIDAIAEAVPGVHLINDQDPGTNILSIRAATTDRLQQASVGFVLDGIPLADTELFTARLFDTERVEVLKGPQGALFGKNASGGVVAINTRRPGVVNIVRGYVVDAQGNRLRDLPARVPANGYVEAGFGNGKLREAEGAASFALPASWVGRVAGLWSAADGWIHNTTLNKLVDATETRMIRLSGEGPAFGLEWQVRSHWLEEDGGAAWASSNNVTGKTGGRLLGDVLINPIGDYEGRAWRRWAQTSVRGTKDFQKSSLEFLIARDSYQKRWDEELDYRPGSLTFFGFPAFPNGIQPIAQPIDVRATTAQLTWNALELRESFGLRLGGFYQATDKDRVDDFGPLLFGAAASAYATSSRQSAVFGELNWRPLEAVSVEFQARYDHDERSQTIRNTANGQLVDDRSKDFGRVQPRVSLRYTPSTMASLYAAYGEAFRPGGFNPSPAAGSIWQSSYRPEITRSFEVGYKNAQALGQTGARLELAAFANSVRDYQNYTFIDGQSVTLNVDEVLVRGFEAAVSFEVTTAGRIGASYALADTEIQRFIATDPLLGSPATRDYSGKAIPNAPQDSAKVWFEWNQTLGAESALELRLDANHVGKTFYELDNVLFSPERWTGDFRARLKLGRSAGNADLTLKVINLTDERWAISAFGQGMTGLLAGLGPDGPFDTFTINRGRQWSLSVRRDF